MDAELDALIRRLARLPGRRDQPAVLFCIFFKCETLMLPLADDLGTVGRAVRNCAVRQSRRR